MSNQKKKKKTSLFVTSLIYCGLLTFEASCLGALIFTQGTPNVHLYLLS
jgi:hypothetical protein